MDPRLRIAGIALGGLVVTGALVSGGVQAAHAGSIVPGVTAAGIDLGGMSRAEATSALEAVRDARRDAAIVLRFEDISEELVPADFGWDLAVDDAVEAAMAVARDGGLLSNTLRHLRATLGAGEDLTVASSHDEALLDQQIERVAADIDQDPGIGDLVGDPRTLEVTAVEPARGLVIDREQARAQLLAAAETDGPDDLQLDVSIQEPTVPMAAVEAAAERAELAIRDGLVLVHGETEVVLSPAQLASMLTLRADGDEGVQLDARTADVERAFADVAGAFESDAIDATFDIDRDPGVTLDAKGAVTWEPQPVSIPITASRPGETFDAALTARQIGDLLERGTDRATIALREVKANFTAEDARGLGITHLLGVFTTYHACCQTRVRNIQRLADLVDGQLVLPGEQFSINQISGIRTCASGFFPAGMILNGEIVDSCGGGVSQFGTTTFNAAFFAGLQLDAWKAHSFYISRYPMGREATLNYPSPDIDVKFTNDTEHGLLIKTSYTPRSITVAIYGQSDVTQVEATRSGTYSPREYSTERRPNPALPPGAEKRIQSGAPGFTVRVNRFVTHADGEVTEDEIVTVYVPEKEIIEFGPGDPGPSPEPTPGPTPEPTPAPEPTQEPTPGPTSEPTAEPTSEPTSEPSEPAPTEVPTPSGGGGGGGVSSG